MTDSERLDEIRKAVEDRCSTRYWFSNREHEAYTDYLPFLLAKVVRQQRKIASLEREKERLWKLVNSAERAGREGEMRG